MVQVAFQGVGEGRAGREGIKTLAWREWGHSQWLWVGKVSTGRRAGAEGAMLGQPISAPGPKGCFWGPSGCTRPCRGL